MQCGKVGALYRVLDTYCRKAEEGLMRCCVAAIFPRAIMFSALYHTSYLRVVVCLLVLLATAGTMASCSLLPALLTRLLLRASIPLSGPVLLYNIQLGGHLR